MRSDYQHLLFLVEKLFYSGVTEPLVEQGLVGLTQLDLPLPKHLHQLALQHFSWVLVF